jgi:hypothetical protein
LEPSVDDVAELAFERAERFLASLAFGDLAVEVGAAGAVGLPAGSHVLQPAHTQHPRRTAAMRVCFTLSVDRLT